MKKTTKSKQQTKEFAKEIIEKNKEKQPLILSLEGPLGSGKTTFIKGIADHLKIKESITSPTFLLIKKYSIDGDVPHKKLVHIDAYRTEPEAFKKLGIEELTKNPDNLVAVEWGSKLEKFLPENTVRLKFDHGEEENERIITTVN